MKKCIISLISFVATIGSHADIVYNVDFEAPTQTDGTGIVSGPGSDIPSFTTGSPTAVIDANLGSFSSQAAFLNNGGQMTFDAPGGIYSSGIFAISYEATMMSVSGGSSLAGISILDEPEAIGIGVTFDSGTMRVGSLGNSVTLPYTLGYPSSFLFLVDLDTYLYSATVDGSLVLEDIAFSSTLDITEVYFNTGAPSPNNSMGVDNFRWEIVPEPSTILMFSLGGILAMLRRKVIN